MNNWSKGVSLVGMFAIMIIGCGDMDEFGNITTPINRGEGTESDNCPLVVNEDQADLDGDRVGDACDNDIDGDDILNESDLCPFVFTALDDCDFNPVTLMMDCDLDNDGQGNECDCDVDGDGTMNRSVLGITEDYYGVECVFGADNCDTIYNPLQSDNDGDGWGNVCDDCRNSIGNDGDHDLLCEEVDNCNTTYNPDQADLDGDGIGDACEGSANADNN